MRKMVIVFGVLALALAALVFAPTGSAQVRRAPWLDPIPLLPVPGGEIGVSVREVRTEELGAAKLEQPGGVFIQDVREGGPAARGGLRSGDIVVEFDGERVRGVRHFSRLVLETPPRRTVRAVIIRNGTRQSIDIVPDTSRGMAMVLPEIGREIEGTLRALPRDFDFDFDLEPRAPRARFGVTLTPLGDQLASYFGVQEGVLVSAVDANSPAAQAGIKAGDVITAINGKAVDQARDVTGSIRSADPGSTLEIRLVRDRKEMTVKATLPERGPAARDRFPV